MSSQSSSTDAKRSEFLQVADAIGARLCRDALWDGERCNWLGDSMEHIGKDWKVAHRALGPDLYGGTSGVALFLGCLFAFTGERLFRKTALGGIRQAISRTAIPEESSGLGFYSGLTGIAYSLVTLSRLFESAELDEHARRVLEGPLTRAPEPSALDVIAGSAGAIPALLTMSRVLGEDSACELAVRHGHNLLATADVRSVGLSWNTLNIPAADRRQDLTGFSHGAAGIGWALLELGEVTGEPRFVNAAEQAFAYERQWFDPAHENWPDFRSLYDPTVQGDRTPGYPVTWCHGAPGIGLSRLRAFDITGTRVYRDEAEAALRCTERVLEAPVEGNFCLCHGAAGNAELFLYAGQVLHEERYHLVATRVGEEGADRYETSHVPWPCGVTGGGECPDLMLGLAGIGQFYLRLYDPEQTPLILLAGWRGRQVSRAGFGL
jgi:lantibiotic modifying enzyme